MNKVILAALSGVALFGIAACSDTDETTTQSTTPPVEDAIPVDPAVPADPAMKAVPPATDDTTTQSIKPAPDDAETAPDAPAMEPTPLDPAPVE